VFVCVANLRASRGEGPLTAIATNAAGITKTQIGLEAAVGLRVRFGPVAYHRLVGIALSKIGTTLKR